MIKKHVSPIDVSFKHIKILIVSRRFAAEQKFKVVDTNDADNTAAVFRCFQKHIFTTNKFVIFWRILNKGIESDVYAFHITFVSLASFCIRPQKRGQFSSYLISECQMTF